MSKPAPWPLWQKIVVPIVALVLAWELLPALDLLVSGWFYRADGGGFWLKDTLPALIVSKGTRYVTTAVVIGVIGLVGWGFAGNTPSRKALGRGAALALLAMVIGPWLIVHPVLKDHWGRPRPAQITDFGGSGTYVPPGIPSHQCDRNCSFTSGHASSGFLWAAGALIWPARRRRWLLIGTGAGLFIGFVRIIQGAHFLSDVLGSGVVVLGTIWAVESFGRARGWLETPKA